MTTNNRDILAASDEKTYDERKNAFIEYLTDQFGEGMSPWEWTCDLLGNVIDYVYKEHGNTKKAAVRILSDLLPEVEMSETEQFMSDYSEEHEPDNPDEGYIDALPDDSLPISREIIREGLHEGVIRIVPDSFDDYGVVAKIGDGWFYFAGIEGENMSPKEYVECVPEDDIVDEIYESLEGFRKNRLKDIKEGQSVVDADNEWCYYKTFLDENVEMEKIASKPSGWELTDESCEQYCRCLGGRMYELIQMSEDNTKTDENMYSVICGVISLNMYTDENLEEEIVDYYESLDDLRRTCGSSSAQVAAEIIFENHQNEVHPMASGLTEQEAGEKIETFIK